MILDSGYWTLDTGKGRKGKDIRAREQGEERKNASWKS